jgi:hypothetical protein
MVRYLRRWTVLARHDFTVCWVNVVTLVCQHSDTVEAMPNRKAASIVCVSDHWYVYDLM